jgi:hypothetical protein
MAGKYCGSWRGSYYYVKKKLDILLENMTPLLKKHPHSQKKILGKFSEIVYHCKKINYDTKGKST